MSDGKNISVSHMTVDCNAQKYLLTYAVDKKMYLWTVKRDQCDKTQSREL